MKSNKKTPFHFKALFLLYRLLWFCATPLLLRFSRLKEGAAERTLKQIHFKKVDLWIHAASVGEAYIAIQILKSFKNDLQLDILLTTNTPQGKEILAQNLGEQPHRVTVAYMVFDNPSLVRKAVQIADPRLLVLVELEIWPALMTEIKRQKKKIIIVNGRMTERSFKGYGKLSFLWPHLKPDTILAISKDSKDRLQTLFQQQNSLHVPNIKFDQIAHCTVSEKESKGTQSLILASIRKEEEQDVFYILTEILRLFPNLHVDIFPRHLHRVSSWEALLSGTGIKYALQSSRPDQETISVIIRDIFGELTRAYQGADAAFIGGSLAPLGGQNFIEAFMNGVIPVTGPDISDFLWTGDEVFEMGLLKKANTKEEVLEFLVDSLNTPVDKQLLQRKANKYIHAKQGGSRKTCQHIVDLLQQSNYKSDAL